MKRKLILLSVFVISMNVSGQFHYIGLQGGLIISNISDDDFVENSKFRKGITTGLNYEFQFSRNLLIGADLLYTQNGYLSDLVFMDETGNIIREKAVVKDYYYYLGLPIKLGYEIGNKIKGFAKIGINTSIILKAQMIIPTFDDNFEETGEYKIDVTNDVKKLDLGGIIELGGRYELNEKFELISLIGYRHSFTTFTSPTFFESQVMKHYSFKISIGLKYKLNKK